MENWLFKFIKDSWLILPTAIGTALIWAFIIEPWLDRRPKKGGFIKPVKYKKIWGPFYRPE